jgi:hypothetical protein
MSLQEDWDAAAPAKPKSASAKPNSASLQDVWDKATPVKTPAKPATKDSALASFKAGERKSQEDTPVKPKRGAAMEAFGAVVEPIIASARNIIAKPLGEAAEVAAIATKPIDKLLGREETDPAAIGRGVRERVGYEPETESGKFVQHRMVEPAMRFLGGPFEMGGEMLSNALRGRYFTQGEGGKPEEHYLWGDPKTHPQLAAALEYGGAGVKEAAQQAPQIAGGRLGARAAAETIPAKQAALNVQRGENAVIDNIRDTSKAHGYIIPPEHGPKAIVAGLEGKSRTERALSGKNAENAARKLGGEVGVKKGEPLSDEMLDARKEANYKVYRDTEEALGPEVRVTQQFADTVDSIIEAATKEKDITPELADALDVAEGFKRRISGEKEPLPGTERTPIGRTIEKTAAEQPFRTVGRPGGAPGNILQTLERASAETPTGVSPFQIGPRPAAGPRTLNTKWAMEKISDLRARAKKDYRNGRDDVGAARMAIANALENMFEANLGGLKGPGVLQSFRAARRQLAKIHLLEQVVDPAGRVNLAKLGQLAEKPAYKNVIDGEFAVAADFANTWRKAAQKPTGEAVPRTSVFDSILAASAIGFTMTGHAWGPLMAAELAGRIAVPYMAEKGLLSNKTPSYEASRTPELAYPALGIAAANAPQVSARP